MNFYLGELVGKLVSLSVSLTLKLETQLLADHTELDHNVLFYFKNSSGFSILFKCVLALGTEQLLLSLLHEDYKPEVKLRILGTYFLSSGHLLP